MNISVSDPFNSLSDPALPALAFALDPQIARKEMKRGLPRLTGENSLVRLQAIRVVRHKPGRRCVVEYDVNIERPDSPSETVTLIGKMRARRFGNEGYRLLDEFWRAGFDVKSGDGISVPEPIGVIPKVQMWFQRKVPGTTATELLLLPNSAPLAGRIAEAIIKVHQTKVPTEREHSIADELRILHECMEKVSVAQPQWNSRLTKILQSCDALAATHPDLPKCGSHRDFYPAQVISDGARIYLIDFDLYCSGDVGLDVGNFLGHLTEQSLRHFGNASALGEVERALENRFVELSGETSRVSVKIYATLTLVRHIFLSTQHPERRKTTEALVKLCEEKLGIS